MDTYYCSRCGNNYPKNLLLSCENNLICENCKPKFLQELREGIEIKNDTTSEVLPENVHFSRYVKCLVSLDIIFSSAKLIGSLYFNYFFYAQVHFVFLFTCFPFLIIGNILLLLKKRWALTICYLGIIITVIDILYVMTNIYSSVYNSFGMANIYSYEYNSFGISIHFFIRPGFLFFYGAALLKARKSLALK